MRQSGKLQGVVLLLPATLVVMAVVALAPDLPQLLAAFEGTPGSQWLVPMILTLPSLTLIVFAPVAGVLGDRYGRRSLLIAALVGYAVLGLMPLLLDDLGAILVSRACVGIAEAFALTLSTTLIGDLFAGRERDRWLGYQTAATAISALVFVAIGGALGRYGWRGPFGIYALPLLFALLIALLTREPSPERRTPQVGVGVQASPQSFPWRVMLRVCAITLFASISFYVAQIQNGVALAAVDVRDPAKIGLLIAVASLGTVAGTTLFRYICAWPLERLLLLSFVCICVGYLVVGSAGGAALLTAAMALAQFGCGILLPSLLTFAIRHLPYEIRGRGTGMWQGVFSVGQFLSPIVVTLFAGQLGGILGAFGAVGALNLLAAACSLLAMRLRGAPPQHL